MASASASASASAVLCVCVCIRHCSLPRPHPSTPPSTSYIENALFDGQNDSSMPQPVNYASYPQKQVLDYAHASINICPSAAHLASAWTRTPSHNTTVSR